MGYRPLFRKSWKRHADSHPMPQPSRIVVNISIPSSRCRYPCGQDQAQGEGFQAEAPDASAARSESS